MAPKPLGQESQAKHDDCPVGDSSWWVSNVNDESRIINAQKQTNLSEAVFLGISFNITATLIQGWHCILQLLSFQKLYWLKGFSFKAPT